MPITPSSLCNISAARPSTAAPQINPDGVSVKGCSIIYAPTGQAGEYSALATNPYRGCGHACAYCYVPQVLRMDRADFDAGAVERTDFLSALVKDARKYQALGITEQVMLSFTTDPYHPGDTSLTRRVLQALEAHGLGICTLTKGGRRALRDLDLFRPGRDAFASTLTSIDPAFSRKWERASAVVARRTRSLSVRSSLSEAVNSVARSIRCSSCSRSGWIAETASQAAWAPVSSWTHVSSVDLAFTSAFSSSGRDSSQVRFFVPASIMRSISARIWSYLAMAVSTRPAAGTLRARRSMTCCATAARTRCSPCAICKQLTVS